MTSLGVATADRVGGADVDEQVVLARSGGTANAERLEQAR
jgi:hypothetical protein